MVKIIKHTKIINDQKDPVLTVGLPMFQTKNIGWLSLEGLCRQQDMKHPWELLIAQEKGQHMPLKKIMTFKDRLIEANCCMFEYWEIKNWISLGSKWHFLAQHSNSKSMAFLLQGADNYPQPRRLIETFEYFDQDDELDWLKTAKGLWYDIGSNTFAYRNRVGRAGRDVAIKMELMKKLPDSKQKSGLDNFLFQVLTKKKGSKIKIQNNNSSGWKGGLCSSGLNNITQKRSSLVANHQGPFEKYNGKVLVPSSVMSKLKGCKKYISNHKFLER